MFAFKLVYDKSTIDFGILNNQNYGFAYHFYGKKRKKFSTKHFASHLFSIFLFYLCISFTNVISFAFTNVVTLWRK